MKEMMEVKEDEKREIKEMAVLMEQIHKLPKEENIAVRYYIKGWLYGIQKSEEDKALEIPNKVTKSLQQLKE